VITDKLLYAPYSKPLSVVNLRRREERFHGVVSGDNKTSHVGQELTPEVEDN